MCPRSALDKRCFSAAVFMAGSRAMASSGKLFYQNSISTLQLAPHIRQAED